MESGVGWAQRENKVKTREFQKLKTKMKNPCSPSKSSMKKALVLIFFFA